MNLLGGLPGLVQAEQPHLLRNDLEDEIRCPNVQVLGRTGPVRGQELLQPGQRLLDACHTYSAAWWDGLANVIAPHRQAVIIGTTRPVGWDEASTYAGAFYAALLSHRFPSQPLRRRAAFLDAHSRAGRAYHALLDEPAPYKAIQIRR